MIVKCRITGKDFEVTDSDLKFYEKMQVPPPTICPEERLRRRLASSNQMHLYKRKCDATGKQIISDYSSDKPMPIYNIDYWWSNQWDQWATGRDFDFNKPFFEQFRDLLDVAPQPALHRTPSYDENCDYTNDCTQNKNCYLIFDSDLSRDSYYSYSINYCQNVVDCFRVDHCELCYECIDCTKCYGSAFLQNCNNCNDSFFLKNCIGCNNCFGSVNLRNKQYYFLNKQCTKEEYFQKLADLGLDKHANLKNMREKFVEYAGKSAHKFMEGVQNEQVIGNYLVNSKNAKYCFDSRNLRDCKYLVQGYETAMDCFDCTGVGDKAQLLYECAYTGMNAHNNRFVSRCTNQVSDLNYCYFTPHCSELFGCAGLKNAKYAILNKQYSKEDYLLLKDKIIEHMRSTGEWGEFFPIKYSPFAYNESVAQDYFPLSKEEVFQKGWKWKDEEKLDDSNQEMSDEVIVCEETAKKFRVLKQELSFYKKLNLPLPHLSFEVRHKNRMKLRNQRELYDRSCNECGIGFQTTFSSRRPETILCRDCYLKVMD